MPTSRPRIVVIGAGMAGILAGIKLLEAGLDNFTIYEKADRVGGTWRDNTYPGLSCDTPSHHYTYTFARNPGWSSYLPPGPEIQAYFEATCDQYDVRRHIRFNEEVESAEFRDGQWQLVMKGGRRDSAHIVIAATGVLHHPSTPHIPGMETFQGTLFHSAHWDHSVALDNRRVGVIGMGSTGVQIISALAGRAALVEHYVRTPQWIMPVQNTPYSEAQRDAFKRDPEALAREMGTEEYLANVNSYTQVITQEDKEAIAYWRETCYRNLEDSVADPALREQLRPDHEVLCKRLIFSPDYYEAIQRPGAALVREDIQAIEANGIRTVDGHLHELDVIALATGFHPDRFMRPMRIVGRDGIDLETFWHDRPKAYLAVSMPGFPNFFMLNGPNGPVGNFTLIDIAEHQWRYIDQLIARIRNGECTEICASADALERFERDRIAAAKTTIWYTGGCKSWYLDKEGIPSSWPWNYNRFVQEMSEPRWEDFDLV